MWHEAYEVDIGPHVFPTRKYRLVKERLLDEGVIAPGDLVRPAPATDDDVALVHTFEYLRKMRAGDFARREVLALEVPFSEGLRRASWICAGGSILAARLARERGVAVHLGGGFHHAFPDHGEGFCLINDVAIAIRRLQKDGAIRHAVVIDLDVHHGNGTAAIFAGDDDVFTFSVHQENNYPPWKPPSDLDIGLEDGCGDAEYLAALEGHLPGILAEHRPDFAFYPAGADPFQHDQLGGLGLSIEGLRARDQLVLTACRAAAVPAAIVLAGGYAIRQADTLEIHCNTVRAAARVARRPPPR